jgi:RNA polymerase sigma-70 factor (ECF subfamily)
MKGAQLEKAFMNDIQDHRGVILKVCRIYSNNRDDFDDLFQEIVLQLWRSYTSFKGESRISTWMYRVALNTAITRLHKSKRRPDSDYLSPFHHNQPDSAEDRIDMLYERELQTAIDTLNKFDRALLMLYLDEKTYQEMAEIMEISENYIGVKINRIKNQLKNIFTP